MNKLKWDRIPVPFTKPMTKEVKTKLGRWVRSEPKKVPEYRMGDTIRTGKYKNKLTLEQIKEHNPNYFDLLLMNNYIIVVEEGE